MMPRSLVIVLILISMALMTHCAWISGKAKETPAGKKVSAIPAPVPAPKTEASTSTPSGHPSPAPEIPPRSETLVRIGRKEISHEEFQKRYDLYLLVADPEKEKVLTRDEYLNRMISDELVQRFAEREKIDKDPLFLARVEKERQSLLLDYILRNVLMEKITVSEEEIANYYGEHIKEFTQEAKIQVRHILTSDEESARKALRRLEAGEDFGDVARDVSIHVSRDQGGRLPPFERGTYNKEFEDAAFPLKVGERSGIVKTDLGYHIIEKTGETPRSVTPLPEVRGKILERLMQEKRERALENFYQKARSEAPVEIFGKP